MLRRSNVRLTHQNMMTPVATDSQTNRPTDRYRSELELFIPFSSHSSSLFIIIFFPIPSILWPFPVVPINDRATLIYTAPSTACHLIYISMRSGGSSNICCSFSILSFLFFFFFDNTIERHLDLWLLISDMNMFDDPCASQSLSALACLDLYKYISLYHASKLQL